MHKYSGVHRQVGATLMEAMISLLVFSIGALGIAALQTTSMIRIDDVKQRSLAVWKAQELVDRMRATKTMQDPDGLLSEYFVQIANTDVDSGIGKFDTRDNYSHQCGATPKRCDDTGGSAVDACTTTEHVEFDLWSVMCDPLTGVAVESGFADGNIGLRNLELAMEKAANEYLIYFEWLSRSADNDEEIRSATAIKIVLCGTEKTMDPRLDAYCIRIQ